MKKTNTLIFILLLFSLYHTTLALDDILDEDVWIAVDETYIADSLEWDVDAWPDITSLDSMETSDDGASGWDDWFAISKAQRARILENFTSRQLDIIYSGTSSILEDDDNIQKLNSKWEVYGALQNNLEEKIRQFSEQTDILWGRIDDISSLLLSIDSDIDTSTKEFNRLSNEIIKTKLGIRDTNIEIKELSLEIDKTKKVLIEYIVHIYKKQNSISSDKDIDNLKAILLSDMSIWDIINQLHYSHILGLAGQRLLDDYRDLMIESFEKRSRLESQKTILWNLQKYEILKSKELQEKRDFRQKVLDMSIDQKDELEKYIESSSKTSRKIWIQLTIKNIKNNKSKKEILVKYACLEWDSSDDSIDASDVIVWVIDCDELNQVLDLEMRLSSFPKSDPNILSWPIDPKIGLSSYFKDKEYLDIVWANHYALDIRAPQWTPIRAPADGYIVYLNPPVDTGYAYVALKHADGYVTVYGHVSKVYFGQYRFIKKGMLFALSGWTPGTIWSWPTSSGPHLHFEVHKDRQYSDPLDYLDLYTLKERFVPKVSKYMLKYTKDFERDTWEEYTGWLLNGPSTFILRWDTEIERQKYLLTTYRAPEFQDWDIWVEEAMDARLDPSMVMCIWLSETWLWNYLKTPYNIWNVWNTDSGATKTFDGVRTWIYQMVKTLNNRYLWWYETINMLSRYWNHDGPIYRSSPDNWHNNMVKCISALKWYDVWDEFEFRLKDEEIDNFDFNFDDIDLDELLKSLDGELVKNTDDESSDE